MFVQNNHLFSVKLSSSAYDYRCVCFSIVVCVGGGGVYEGLHHLGLQLETMIQVRLEHLCQLHAVGHEPVFNWLTFLLKPTLRTSAAI